MAYIAFNNLSGYINATKNKVYMRIFLYYKKSTVILFSHMEQIGFATRNDVELSFRRKLRTRCKLTMCYELIF
jgi:hypothetical protein